MRFTAGYKTRVIFAPVEMPSLLLWSWARNIIDSPQYIAAAISLWSSICGDRSHSNRNLNVDWACTWWVWSPRFSNLYSNRCGVAIDWARHAELGTAPDRRGWWQPRWVYLQPGRTSWWSVYWAKYWLNSLQCSNDDSSNATTLGNQERYYRLYQKAKTKKPWPKLDICKNFHNTKLKPVLPDDAPIAVVLFAGGGGIEAGMVQAGIRPVIAVEFVSMSYLKKIKGK